MTAGPSFPIASAISLPTRATEPFFFQAEDGIRDGTVTGVQTCALPIWAIPGQGFRDLDQPVGRHARGAGAVPPAWPRAKSAAIALSASGPAEQLRFGARCCLARGTDERDA